MSTDTSRRFDSRTLAVVLAVGLLTGAGIAWSIARRAPSPSAADAPDKATALSPGVVELTAEAQRNAGVTVDAVKSIPLPAVLEVTGRVTPPESRVAHIRPLASGLVEQVHVTLGARVTAGQPLATYDNISLGQLIGEYLSQAAALRQAETDASVKQSTLTRAEELIKLEAIAQQTLDLRRAEAKNAGSAIASEQARLAKVEEQLHRFGLSDADISRLSSVEGANPHRTASHNVLRAPFTGIITKLDVAAGEAVEPDRELFTLMDLSTVWVLADAYEKDLTRVRPDVDAVVTTDAYPGRMFGGRVTYVSDVIDPKTRTATVRAVVPNPDGALKLEMFVKVGLPTSERHDAVVVPVAAVQRIDDKPILFLRRSDGRFERRDVRLGLETGGLVEVVSGVKAGDLVITAGSFYLKTAILRERIGGE